MGCEEDEGSTEWTLGLDEGGDFGEKGFGESCAGEVEGCD